VEVGTHSVKKCTDKVKYHLISRGFLFLKILLQAKIRVFMISINLSFYLNGQDC